MKPNGKPETTDVLLAWADGENPYEKWPEWEKVVAALSGRLADRMLVEYGTSVGHCWLTPKGKQRVRELRDND